MDSQVRESGGFGSFFWFRLDGDAQIHPHQRAFGWVFVPVPIAISICPRRHFTQSASFRADRPQFLAGDSDTFGHNSGFRIPPTLFSRNWQRTMFHRTNLVTGAAFIIVIVMMAGMVGLAMSGMHDIQKHLGEVVSVNAEKLRQVAIMRRSNRERIIDLQRMLILDDIFEIDEVAMQHMGHANHFIGARRKLYEMATTAAETEALDRIKAASMKAAPINDNIRDLALAEEPEKAKALMLENLAPVQDNIYAEFTKLVKIYEGEAERAKVLAQKEYQTVYQRLVMLLAMVVGLCVLIAVNVIRRVSRSEQALVEHGDQLERTVAARTAELSEQVAERERAEQRARKESERLSVTLASIGDGVVTIKPDSTVEYMNPAAELLTQFTREQVTGRPVEDVLRLVNVETGEDRPLFTEPSSKDAESAVGGDDVLRRRDGELLDVQRTIADIRDEEGSSYGAVVVLRDVSEARALERRLAHEATHDPLTGLVNRREFESKVSAALAEARASGATHTLCYVDLDRFKSVNDSCGHAAGDKLLQELSERIRGRLRKADTFARLGGDEFGLLLEQCPVENGVVIAESVRRLVADYRLVFDDQVFSVGASVGVVAISRETPDLETLLSVADAACYNAKERGRDCVQVFQPSDDVIVARQGEARWARSIRKALEDSRFELHCQPIVGAMPSSHDECHFEVLVRLRSEDGELVYPGAFMPAALRYGLLTAIDRYVIGRTLEWLGRNGDLNDSGRLSINVAGASLSDPSFLEFVTERFTSSGANPTSVIFEITENVAVSNLDAAIALMSALGDLGCQFALDDFGRGFSSLGALKDLPVDYLKIDGGFVRNILSDAADEATVTAINDIGHALGKRTVAEFVENDDIRDRLCKLGVDFVQGFGIARPGPIDEVLRSFRSDARDREQVA